MAGIGQSGVFVEKISPFLKKRLEELKHVHGEESNEYQGIFLQYVKSNFEELAASEDNNRHWEADLKVEDLDHFGIERLYNKTAVIEPTMICAAHCRYCLRANYKIFTLEEEQIINIAKYCGTLEINEVLITGGDPLIVPKRLDLLLDSLIEYAPNVEIFRVATRLPVQDPNRITDEVFDALAKHTDKVKLEIATQINHPSELFPESVEIYKKFIKMGIPVYSQNVLLKGVNDDIEVLVKLYNKLREIGINAHYLFHSVPMRGTHHLRTSIVRGIELAKQLTNSGRISGRIKPHFAVMTDIGKIILHEGLMLGKNETTNRILLQSNYSLENRLKNNPSWTLPENVEVDENGMLRVWYLDGND